MKYFNHFSLRLLSLSLLTLKVYFYLWQQFLNIFVSAVLSQQAFARKSLQQRHQNYAKCLLGFLSRIFLQIHSVRFSFFYKGTNSEHLLILHSPLHCTARTRSPKLHLLCSQRLWLTSFFRIQEFEIRWMTSDYAVCYFLSTFLFTIYILYQYWQWYQILNFLLKSTSGIAECFQERDPPAPVCFSEYDFDVCWLTPT